MTRLLHGPEEENFYLKLAKEDGELGVIDIGSLVQVRDRDNIDPERVFVVSRMDDDGNYYLNMGTGELPEPFEQDDLQIFTGEVDMNDEIFNNFLDSDSPENPSKKIASA